MAWLQLAVMHRRKASGISGLAALLTGSLLAACGAPGSPGPAARMGSAAPTVPAVSVPSDRKFPVGVSANHRYLVDQDGDPYLLVGDSPQCITANLSLADMNRFFADRERQGFNAMWVDMLCGPYTGGRRDFSTYDGIRPFTQPGDLSSPNPDYFARVDSMVSLAARYGITLLLQPAETGSFRDLLRSNGTAKDFAYGAYVGARYRNAPNIIWLSGNDYQTDQWGEFDPYTTALARGLRSADPRRLQTVELNYPVSLSTDNPNWSGLIDINSAYTYAPTYTEVLRGYNGTPPRPVVMLEANYEGEHNPGGPPADAQVLRRQEYWTMLSGAAGQLYGNHYTWGFQYGPWAPHIDTPGAAEVTVMVKLFTSLRWYDLVPDQDHRLVTSGYGEPASTGLVAESDYVTAAITSDGSTAIVYLPSPRPITVDLTRFPGPVTARWFDPTNGTFTAAASGTIPNAGTRSFDRDRANGAGAQDWVLVLTAGS